MFKFTLAGRYLAVFIFSLGMALSLAMPQKAQAQDGYIGEIRAFGFTFCPRGWTEADGDLLAINANTALFSLFGTIYGGDGRTTFGLPDLRGRAPIAPGAGPGLPTYVLGQPGGDTSFTLTTNEMPAHSHTVMGTNATADKHGPGTDLLAAPYLADSSKFNIYHDGPPNREMDPRMIANSGNGQPVTHRGPYLPVQWCVALSGVFPSRN